MSKPDLGKTRTQNIEESEIRKMTREALKHGAINLSQGYPDEEMTPKSVKEEAKKAIQNNNQYSITWGLPELRKKVAKKYGKWRNLNLDPEKEITITCGTSEAVMSSILALAGKGDGVIYFEPAYENYIPSTQISEAEGKPVEITTDLKLNKEQLKKQAKNSKLLLLNTPHNPTGKVFTEKELNLIADLAEDEDLIIISDEIYEHMVYEGKHISPTEIKNLKQRTVLCTGISKTYSVTGWRVGFLIAPKYLSNEIRKIHDYISICAPTPFQKASTKALELPKSYYKKMNHTYKKRRNILHQGLKETNLNPTKPNGSYYMIANFKHLNQKQNDKQFAKKLAKQAKVATVPGTSFYKNKKTNWIRFTFSRSENKLKKAIKQIKKNKWW